MTQHKKQELKEKEGKKEGLVHVTKDGPLPANPIYMLNLNTGRAARQQPGDQLEVL